MVHFSMGRKTHITFLWRSFCSKVFFFPPGTGSPRQPVLCLENSAWLDSCLLSIPAEHLTLVPTEPKVLIHQAQEQGSCQKRYHLSRSHKVDIWFWCTDQVMWCHVMYVIACDVMWIMWCTSSHVMLCESCDVMWSVAQFTSSGEVKREYRYWGRD